MAAANEVERYLVQLRRRSLLLHLGRALLASIVAGALILAVLSVAVGPTIGTAGAVFCWALVGLFASATLVSMLRPLRRQRGDAIAERIEEVSKRLGSAARSAVELARAGDRSELARAHAAQVAKSLGSVPVREVVPARALWPRRLVAALAMGTVAMALLFLSDSTRMGTFALLHPGASEGEDAIADLVSELEYRCRLPAYLGGEEQTLLGGDLELPVGTIVEVSMKSRIDLAAPRIEVASVPVAMEGQRREWVARFVVEESGGIEISGRNVDGQRLRDASPRHLIAKADAAPEIHIDETLLPERAGEALASDAELILPYAAADDHGLALLRLVVRTPAGEVVRRELFNALDALLFGVEAPPSHAGIAYLNVADLGARPGDAIHIWIEGSDHDDLNGPNQGRSDDLRLVIASESARREAVARDLRAIMEQGLDALADRLERTDFGEAARFEVVQGSTTLFRNALQQAAQQEREGVDTSVLGAMGRRLGRQLQSERWAQGRGAGLERADRALVDAIETQVLFLADLEHQVRLEDAAAIARELDSLRREMTSLLEELRRADSPEARRELLAAIARAQARLAELGARLAAMNEEGPSEFLNMESLDQEATADALSEFERAVREGDLDRAEQQLMELQRQIDQMAGSLDQASGEFGDQRFGPRERAMADAMDRLSGLETEQRQLAGRSEETRRATADAALEAAGSELEGIAQRLEGEARRAAERVRGVQAEQLGPFDQETRELALQRLEDAAEALAQGDLGEARSMAGAAQQHAMRLARELELSALMYPGSEGRTLQASRDARAAADATGALGRALDSALPRVREHVQDEGRAQLSGDRPRQSAAGDAAESLSELFRSEPDGTPLSPESADAVDRARDAMEQASDAMQQSDPMEAARAQSEAARELSELRDRLEEQQRQQQQQGGGGGATPRERIELPGAQPREDDRRRELLDAIQRRSPDGFADANRRYYEGLLR